MDSKTENKFLSRPDREISIIQAKRTTVYTSRGKTPVTHIVVHYTGVPNQTAARAIAYFASKNAETSTHFVVDETGIFQVLPVEFRAWHVAKGEVDEHFERAKDADAWHKTAAAQGFKGNASSIGIDMCARKASPGNSVKDNDWFFTDGTIRNAAKLVAHLMREYHLPIDRVIRHMDATGKPCPRPFVSLKRDGDTKNDTAWINFLSEIKHLTEGEA